MCVCLWLHISHSNTTIEIDMIEEMENLLPVVVIVICIAISSSISSDLNDQPNGQPSTFPTHRHKNQMDD